MTEKICPVCGNEIDQWGYCFHHCHYCFKPLNTGEICSCGYEEQVRPPMTLREGTTLDNGKYILGAVLGKGGFGITYLGFQPGLQARVAIKEYFPSDIVTRGKAENKTCVISQSPYYETFLTKFKNEAIILEKFSHVRNIVQVKNLLEENNTAYIVMEYVDGFALKDIIRENGGKIRWETLHELLDPVLVALQQIHDGGIIHRDIAPDNILVDKTGKAILIDFGTARFSRDAGSSVPVGKEGYTPVEQIKGANSQDPRTDVYALGATYYKALTGKTPLNAKARLVNDNLPQVNEEEPSVPDHISNAIMKALAPNIEDRWDSVADFRDALNTEPETKKQKQKKEKGKDRETTADLNNAFNTESEIEKQKREKEKEKGKGKGNNKKKTALPFLIFLALLSLAAFLFFLLKPSYPDFIVQYMEEANKGDASALIELGNAWFTGEGVRQNYRKGCRYYQKAADQGYGPGEYYLAKCYLEGKGVQQSSSEYLRWLERAARHNLPEAQYDLGHFFEMGYDGRPDLSRAEYWYQKSAENGFEQAELWLQNQGK